MSWGAAIEHTIGQLELMAEAAERVQAERALLLSDVIRAATASTAGVEPTAKPLRKLQRELKKIIDG